MLKHIVRSIAKLISILLFFVCIGSILLACVSGVIGKGSAAQINALKNQSNSPFQSSLTRGRWALVKALGDDGSIVIDKFAVMTFPDVIYNNGHYYSVFVPGPVFFALPLYAIAKNANLSVIAVNLLGPISIVLLAIVLLCILSLLQIRLLPALTTIVAIIFGTQLFTFATIFNAHYLSALAVALAALSAVLVICHKQWGIGYPLFWFALGFGIIADFPNAVTLLPIGLLLLFDAIRLKNDSGRKKLTINSFFFISALAALLFLLPLALYTRSIFGTFLTTIETHQINGFLDHGRVNYTLVANPEFYLNRQIIHKTLNLNIQYLPMGLFTLLFSPARGLFIYSPLVLMALFGIPAFLKRQKNILIAYAAAIAATIGIYSCYADYAGGWSYGPRFFIGIMPLIAIFLAFAVQYAINKLTFLIPFVLAAIFSFGTAALGALTSKLLPSPIENGEWGWNNSFLQNIANLRSEQFVSFVYDYFLKNQLTHEQFLAIIIACITGLFALLIIGAIITENVEQ